MSLRVKLLAPIVTLVVLVMTATSWLSYHQSSEALEGSIIQAGKLQLITLDQILNTTFSTAVTSVTDLSQQPFVRRILDYDKAPDPKGLSEQVSKRLKQFTDNFDIYQSVGILDKKGVGIAFNTPSNIGQDFSDRPYFPVALRGETCISDVLKSRSPNADGSYPPITVIAIPMRTDDGSVAGVMIVTVDMQVFSQKYLAGLVTDATYPYLLTREGLVAAHPNKSLILDPSVANNPVFKKFISVQESVEYYPWQGGERIGISRKNLMTGLTMVIGGDVAKLFAPVVSMRNLNMVLVGVSIVLLVGVIFLLLNSMLKALGQGLRFAGAVADGRLNEQLEYQSKDEIGALADALRKMVGALRDMIRTSEQKTREAEEQSAKAAEATAQAEAARLQAEGARREGLLQAANQLEGIVEVVSSAAEELSAQIEQSDRGAAQQSLRVSETAVAMEEMNATVIEVARTAGSTADVSNDARKKAEEGAGIVREVIAGIGAVQKQSLDLKRDMGELGQQAESIGHILNVISDIADQTNLLALNAAIEAARAGDAGRGFAVVADEVRKLAEKTMQATTEVGNAIRSIQSGANKNINNVEASVKGIEGATALAQKSGDALMEIVKMVEQASNQVRGIASASKEQSTASEQITQAVDQVKTISSETARAMGEAAKAVSELANQSQVLKRLVDDLKRS